MSGRTTVAALTLLALAACSATPGGASRSGPVARADAPPNVIIILADDLGYGEIGCYGQEKIRTPHIDRLTAEGMRFTQFYSGSTVCAPARCTLLTGLHTGHASIRDNDEMPERGDVWGDPALEGQRPLPGQVATLGHLGRSFGYATAFIGKWGLGWIGSEGDPNRQGFDHFFGYACQRQAHNFYPTHLWRNGEKVPLDNPPFAAHQSLPEGADPDDPASYAGYEGKEYSHDLLVDESLRFVRERADRPFLLLLAPTIPHVAIQVPEDSLAEYRGKWPDPPYVGDKGYLPHPTPRAGYAAMVSRLDRDLGRLVALLEELAIADDTIVLFTSDNGPTYGRVGGSDSDFFESAGDLRGRKGSLYEGGIRVPFIAWGPGRVPAGVTTEAVGASWDLMLTLADILSEGRREDPEGWPLPPGHRTGRESTETFERRVHPDGTVEWVWVEAPHGDTSELREKGRPWRFDGESLAGVLLGRRTEPGPRTLYWELASYGGQQALRLGDWKGIRRNRKEGNREIELYDLARDPGETTDVAEANPQIVESLAALMESERTPSELFPLPGE